MPCEGGRGGGPSRVASVEQESTRLGNERKRKKNNHLFAASKY